MLASGVRAIALEGVTVTITELKQTAELYAQDADYWQARADAAEEVCNAIAKTQLFDPHATLPLRVLAAFTRWKEARS